jgi:BirA family transcriptional regulator, biotin operon repressor / biotin---[acetyl-CoA-carboxylase] ligase
VSMLFPGHGSDAHQWTRIVAVAACRAVQAVCGTQATLKWPNDVLVGEAKLAGVLAEAGQDRQRQPFCVVGLGLNVGWAPDGAARLGDGVEPDAVLGALLAAIDDLEREDDEAPGTVRAEYRRRLATLGQRVRVTLVDAEFEGVAVDLDEAGRLVVQGVDSRRTVEVGDVIHLRPVAN